MTKWQKEIMDKIIKIDRKKFILISRCVGKFNTKREIVKYEHEGDDIKIYINELPD